MCIDLSSSCYRQAWREVCADVGAARAMNEDNKGQNRERRSHALLKGTRLKGGVEGNQSKEGQLDSAHHI